MPEWLTRKLQNWPEGALARALARDFPGCKSVLEAYAQAVNGKDTKQEPVQDQSKEMAALIDEVSKTIGDYDIEKLPDKAKEYIKKFTLNNINEAKLWRDAWIKVMSRVRELEK